MFGLKTTSCFLIWLILFQSFSAVANLLDFHSVNVQHLSEVHEHQNNTKSKAIAMQQGADSVLDEATHNPADCHHCGHCNGSHAQWLEPTSNNPIHSLVTPDLFYYLSIVIEAPLTQLLRPPRV